MKFNKIILILLIAVSVFPLLYADTAPPTPPENTHDLELNLAIENISEFPDYVFVSQPYSVGNLDNPEEFKLITENDNFLPDGYKFNSFRLFAIKESYFPEIDIKRSAPQSHNPIDLIKYVPYTENDENISLVIINKTLLSSTDYAIDRWDPTTEYHTEEEFFGEIDNNYILQYHMYPIVIWGSLVYDIETRSSIDVYFKINQNTNGFYLYKSKTITHYNDNTPDKIEYHEENNNVINNEKDITINPGNCTEQGGSLEIRGPERICTFEDNSQCEERKLMNGTCFKGQYVITPMPTDQTCTADAIPRCGANGVTYIGSCWGSGVPITHYEFCNISDWENLTDNPDNNNSVIITPEDNNHTNDTNANNSDNNNSNNVDNNQPQKRNIFQIIGCFFKGLFGKGC